MGGLRAPVVSPEPACVLPAFQPARLGGPAVAVLLLGSRGDRGRRWLRSGPGWATPPPDLPRPDTHTLSLAPREPGFFHLLCGHWLGHGPCSSRRGGPGL